MAIEERLVYQREVFINLSSSYQWVSMKLFATTPALADDREVLKVLTRHVRYRDSYAGTGDKDMETIHGPYWLNAVMPESFSSVSQVDVEASIQSWAECAAPMAEHDRADIEREIFSRIRQATSCYRLADLRVSAEHDWGWVVGSSTGFHEFVLINGAAGNVALVVASDD